MVAIRLLLMFIAIVADTDLNSNVRISGLRMLRAQLLALICRNLRCCADEVQLKQSLLFAKFTMAPKRTIAEVGGKKAAGAGSGKKAAAKPAAKPAAAAPKKAAASAPAKKQAEKKAEKKKQSTSLPQPEFTADEFEAIFQALSAHPAAKWCSEDDIEDMIDELER